MVMHVPLTSKRKQVLFAYKSLLKSRILSRIGARKNHPDKAAGTADVNDDPQPGHIVQLAAKFYSKRT